MREAAATASGVIERAIDVVVVEDDEDARELLRGLLTRHRFTVRATVSAETAFATIATKVPDVVVMDMVLGSHGATGLELAEALRHGAWTKHLALIAVTGRVEPRAAVVRAFDAYLRKPVDPALLIDLVGQFGRVSRDARAARHERPTSLPATGAHGLLGRGSALG